MVFRLRSFFVLRRARWHFWAGRHSHLPHILLLCIFLVLFCTAHLPHHLPACLPPVPPPGTFATTVPSPTCCHVSYFVILPTMGFSFYMQTGSTYLSHMAALSSLLSTSHFRHFSPQALKPLPIWDGSLISYCRSFSVLHMFIPMPPYTAPERDSTRSVPHTTTACAVLPDF